MNDTKSVDKGTDEQILNIQDLHVSYNSVKAIRGISLGIEPGTVTALVGPNGAGKSTLADAITGFKSYERGSIVFDETEIGDKSSPELVGQGLIYCTESKDLFDYMTVRDNLDLGAYCRDVDTGQQREFVYDIFPRLAERESQVANTMSGGEQQMLAIGRALMSNPRFFILDEPSLGLAPVILEDISEGIEQIRAEGMTILLLEQNITFAMEHADFVYLIENGTIERKGSPEELEDDEYIRSAYIGS